MNIFSKIIPVELNEADSLTRIAFRSKAHWGYPNHWLEAWHSEIELTTQSIQSESVFKAVNEHKEILGYYRLSGFGKKLTLNGFWVLPEFMGKGVGRALFIHMLKTARSLCASIVEWESDPNTTPFYSHVGASQIGERTYFLDGKKRTLPIMQIKLAYD